MITTHDAQANGKAADHLAALLDHHLRELRASGLSDATITAAGIKSETDFRTLATFLKREKYPPKNGPAIVFPFHDVTGAVALWRVKPDNSPSYNGRKQKYLQPSGVPCMAYITPAVRAEFERDPIGAVYITEGEKKSLCVSQYIRPCIGLTGIDCWHRKKSAALLPDLAAISWKGRPVRIVFDAPANEDVRRAESELAAALVREGAEVKIVRLPPGPNGEKVGVDDYLVANGVAAFWKLVDVAEEPTPVEGEDLRRAADSIDPGAEAKAILKADEQDGLPRLRYYRGAFILYSRGAYRDIADSEIRARVVRHLDKHLYKLSASKVNDVLMHLRAHSLLNYRMESPAWLSEPPYGWQAKDCFATPTQIVNVQALLDGKTCTTKATPNLFTTFALDYEFNERAALPKLWHSFLEQLWPGDRDSIDCLQEWFGYLLMRDTRQHKILMLLGPKRSGKGTIARLLQAMVGRENTCNPTFGGIGSRFGLWQLMNKSVAVISDARLSGRTDQAAVVETLLSVSGEDGQTIDRKCLEPVSGVTLPTRFVILTNEAPRLTDSSGALASRFILLKLSESFLGREDHDLTEKLVGELPGILIWAVVGSQRLCARGRFIQPASGAELLGEINDLSSPISAFIRDRCRVGAEFDVRRADLYAEYKLWCEEHGKRKPDEEATFGRNLRAVLPRLGSANRREDGSRERYYTGISLG